MSSNPYETNFSATPSSTEISSGIDPEAKEAMLSLARWQTFFAVLGAILSGLIILLMFGQLLVVFLNGSAAVPALGASAFMLVLMGLFYVLPTIRLFQASAAIRKFRIDQGSLRTVMETQRAFLENDRSSRDHWYLAVCSRDFLHVFVSRIWHEILTSMKSIFKASTTTILWFCCLVAVGCKMTAPIHTWKAAKVDHAPAMRIAVGPIGVASRATNTLVSSVPELQAAATSLQEAMQSTNPSTNPNLLAIHPQDLERASPIQLVSYDQQPNDSAMLGAARNSNAQLILQGNVVNAYLEPPDPIERPTIRSMIFGKKKPPQFITTHWTIIDVSTGQRIAEETRTMDSARADKYFKQNGFQGGKSDGSLMAAAAKDAWGIVASTTQKSDAQLDLPWFWAGSSRVRKGNGFARQGRWDLAEQEWQDAAENHPWNKAAWKNLSISAVAREDFELARSRLKHADTFWPGDSTFKTQLWLEKQQRQYHKAMGVPPPEGGWTFPDATIAVIESNHQ